MGLERGTQVQFGLRGGPECPGSAQQQWVAGGCAMQERASAHQVGATTAAANTCAVPRVNPKELTEPISGPSGGAHGYTMHSGGRAAGTGLAHNSCGQHEYAWRLGSIKKWRLEARGGCGARWGWGSAHWVDATGAGGTWGAYQGRCWGPGIRLAQGAAEHNRRCEPGQRPVGVGQQTDTWWCWGW
jgi:hypothetical protein